MEDLAAHLRNLVAASMAGAPLDLPDHELKTLREQAGSADPVELVRLFDLVLASLKDVSEAAQPRHAVEIALLRAIYLAPSSSVQSLLARADEIARRLGGETPPSPPGGGRGPTPPSPSLPSRPRPALFDAPGGPPVRASAPAAPTPPRQEAAAIAAIEAPAPVPAPPPAALPDPPPPRVSPATKPWDRHLSLVPPPEGATRLAPPAPVVPPPPVETRPVEPVSVTPPVEVPRPMGDAALSARWPELVEGIRTRKRVLGSFLEHARPLSLANGELALAFSRGDLYAEKVRTEKGSLENVLTELLQAPTRLKIVELSASDGPSVASLAETNDRQDREAREARLRGGREHPAILRAVAVLGGEIEDVRDLGGGSP
jgi:DNA polymerase-3 subunit gamma/tau